MWCCGKASTNENLTCRNSCWILKLVILLLRVYFPNCKFHMSRSQSLAKTANMWNWILVVLLRSAVLQALENCRIIWKVKSYSYWTIHKGLQLQADSILLEDALIFQAIYPGRINLFSIGLKPLQLSAIWSKVLSWNRAAPLEQKCWRFWEGRMSQTAALTAAQADWVSLSPFLFPSTLKALQLWLSGVTTFPVK